MKKLLMLGTMIAVLISGTQISQASSVKDAFHFGFKKGKDGQVASINEEGFKHILEKHGAIFMGDTKQKELYLTFDNGYENGYTTAILDVLKEKKVPAAFFVTGHYLKDQPDLVRRMSQEGHIVGNHSWSHPDLTVTSNEKIKLELDQVKEETKRLTGKEYPYLRPPRGIFSDRTLEVSRGHGYTDVFWSIAYKDWDTNDQKGSSYAYDQVIKQLHPGAVILLHSVSKDNKEALGSIIDAARAQGYTFKSLDELKTKTY